MDVLEQIDCKSALIVLFEAILSQNSKLFSVGYLFSKLGNRRYVLLVEIVPEGSNTPDTYFMQYKFYSSRPFSHISKIIFRFTAILPAEQLEMLWKMRLHCSRTAFTAAWRKLRGVLCCTSAPFQMLLHFYSAKHSHGKLYSLGTLVFH